MSRLPIQRRTLALLAVVVPLLALFIYVVLRSGPLAPVAVTVATVEQQTITPGLFGIGTVEARTIYHVGPTVAGRVLRLSVEVGDRVTAGQVLGEMDVVDLDERQRAQAAAVQRLAPVFHLRYPRDFQRSAQLLDLLQRHFDELTARAADADA